MAARGRGRRSFVGDNPNSAPMGSGSSRRTSRMADATGWPTRKLRTRMSMASGSCISNLRRRRRPARQEQDREAEPAEQGRRMRCGTCPCQHQRREQPDRQQDNRRGTRDTPMPRRTARPGDSARSCAWRSRRGRQAAPASGLDQGGCRPSAAGCDSAGSRRCAWQRCGEGGKIASKVRKKAEHQPSSAYPACHQSRSQEAHHCGQPG